MELAHVTFWSEFSRTYIFVKWINKVWRENKPASGHSMFAYFILTTWNYISQVLVQDFLALIFIIFREKWNFG